MANADDTSGNYTRETENIPENGQSYNETLKLPYANSNEASNLSGSNNYQVLANTPNSISDYKKLGYSNFSKSKWSGTTKVASTKSKRIAAFMSEQLAGIIPQARIPLAAYDLSQTIKTQHPDLWPTSNLRNILADTPRGNEEIIGQESIVKYYSNSSRTKLVKTVHRTNWRG